MDAILLRRSNEAVVKSEGTDLAVEAPRPPRDGIGGGEQGRLGWQLESAMKLVDGERWTASADAPPSDLRIEALATTDIAYDSKRPRRPQALGVAQRRQPLAARRRDSADEEVTSCPALRRSCPDRLFNDCGNVPERKSPPPAPCATASRKGRGPVAPRRRTSRTWARK